MRNRIVIVTLLFLVVLLGLASRKYSWLFPECLGKYPGDALWSIAVYLALVFVLPKTSPIKLLTLALGISYGVELSQLYQAQWINQIREHTLGHLFLGSTFGYPDLIAYTVGIIIIFLVDAYLKKNRKAI